MMALMSVAQRLGLTEGESRRGWLTRVVVVLTALAVLTRLPGLILSRMFNVDESYLATMGVTIARGGNLYRDAVDRKPPVLPWLYSLALTLTGSEDLRLLRLLACVVVAATGVVVTVLVLRLTDNRTAAFLAGALVVLGTVAFLPADAQAANFELFALLPASAAVLLAVAARPPAGTSSTGGGTNSPRGGTNSPRGGTNSPRGGTNSPRGGTNSPRGGTRRSVALFVGAGLMVGLAGMIKQPFFAILAPVAWEAWRSSRRTLALGATAAGVVAAVVGLGLPFGLVNVWRWAWVDTGDYLGGAVDVPRTVAMLALVVGVFAVMHLPTLSSVWSNRARARRVDPVIWVWLLGALIAVVPGFRFIAHYFELVVPPLAGLTGALAAAAIEGAGAAAAIDGVSVGARPRPGSTRRILVGSGIIAVVCSMLAMMPFANADQVRPELVSEIQSHSGPNDRILVWGALPETYWRARRLPGARFLSEGYVTGKWADRPNPPRDAEDREPFRSRWRLFNSDLRAHPPTVVVDTSTSGMDGWNRYGPEDYTFGSVLTSCYTNDGRVDGMTIWTLNDRACVERMATGA